MTEVARQVVISGRVQGVGFRYWTQREAEARGLCGWVRNRRDGAVEAVFSGPEPAVAGMIAACWKGPSFSGVRAVEVTVYDGDLPSRFEVRR